MKERSDLLSSEGSGPGIILIVVYLKPLKDSSDIFFNLCCLRVFVILK